MKVLDFGLAKLAPSEPRPAPSDVTASPTITSPAMMTGVGVLLGTAAYMTPEQAKGREADKRSDIWAFGCVLYEMLTGRRPFEGEDVSDTLASVLKSEPDWSALPADVPPHIRILIQRCLAKDRRQRTADMSVALFVMTEATNLAPATPLTGSPVVAARPPLWRRLVAPATALIVGGAAVGTGVWVATRPSAPRVTRFTFSSTGAAALSVDTQSRDLAITPDGTRVIYKGTGGPTSTQLFVRSMDQLEPTPLTVPGTPRGPFVSPDGQWIGFVEPGPVTLKKVAITGGSAIPLSVLDGASRGATWGDDDSIIFATNAPSTGLQRVLVERWRADGPDETESREGGRRSPLAAVPAWKRGRSVHHHRGHGRHRCLSRRGLQSADRHAKGAAARRQPGALRPERPSGVRRRRHAARRRL